MKTEVAYSPGIALFNKKIYQAVVEKTFHQERYARLSANIMH